MKLSLLLLLGMGGCLVAQEVPKSKCYAPNIWKEGKCVLPSKDYIGECDLVACEKMPPKPEPVDVPAIRWNKWTTLEDLGFGGASEDLFKSSCLDWGKQYSAEKKACLKPYWGCADKTRILLTSEDGKKHCIKFPKPQTRENQ